MKENSALILIDFVNEIVHEDGNISKKGYNKFIQENNTFEKVNDWIKKTRKKNIPVIWVRVCFEKDYSNHFLKNSKVLGKAPEYKILQDGSWSARIHKELDAREQEDLWFEKQTISCFKNRDLLQWFANNTSIQNVYFGGVATDLAIESAVREAHDMNLIPHVVEEICVAQDKETHDNSIKTMSKFSEII